MFLLKTSCHLFWKNKMLSERERESDGVSSHLVMRQAGFRSSIVLTFQSI